MKKLSLFLVCLLIGALFTGCSYVGQDDGGVVDVPHISIPEAESVSDSIEAVFHESATTDESIGNETKSENSDITGSFATESFETEIVEADNSTVAGSEDAGAFTTTDWKEFEVAIDGVVVKFPCSYQEFVDKTGYRLEKEEYAQQTLRDGYEANEWLIADTDPNRSITVYFYNDSDTMKTYEDCRIYGIYTYPNKELNGKTYASFALVNGVDGHSTSDQIVDMLGKPMRESNIDGAVILRYTVNETGSGGQAEFQFTPDGELDTFLLKAH